MATSGQVSGRPFDVRRVIESAARRCAIPGQALTGEHIEIALDVLNLQLSEMVGKGIPLWTIEKLILGLYENQARLETPSGTNAILKNNINRRTLSRLTGTYASSAGGTVANGFDDDFDTSITQVSTNGNVSIEFESETIVTSIGLLANAAATYTLAFERSDDGVTYTTVDSPDAFTTVAGNWYWFDIDAKNNLSALFFRIRETAGATLNFREIFFGNTPSEIPLGDVNKDDYTNLPNKTFQGQVVQYWQDRQREQPTLWLWPVCGRTWRYDHLVVLRQRYIEDVTLTTQVLDVPQRWTEAVTAELAVRLCRELQEAKKDLLPMLKGEAAEAMSYARGEERDPSPMVIQPWIGAYTR